MPDERFMTPLAEGATQLHELYEAWLNAGFTQAQAMELVKAFTVEAVRLWMEADGDAPTSAQS